MDGIYKYVRANGSIPDKDGLVMTVKVVGYMHAKPVEQIIPVDRLLVLHNIYMITLSIHSSRRGLQPHLKNGFDSSL